MTLSPDSLPGLVLQRVTPPLRLADFKLIAFDMDSTLINIECIDEIADAVGKKAEVAAITEATMRGEIKDFKESLRRRVALLQGVPVQALQQVYDERLQAQPGRGRTGAACKAAGLKVLLVSGGFTFFAEPREATGWASTSRAPTCWRSRPAASSPAGSSRRAGATSATAPRSAARCWRVASLMGIAAQQAIAVGDGANDLPMMGEAGLSVAYHAKPKVREQAMVAINEGGLDRLLEVARP
jgi:phosphoserine phosphatase